MNDILIYDGPKHQHHINQAHSCTSVSGPSVKFTGEQLWKRNAQKIIRKYMFILIKMRNTIKEKFGFASKKETLKASDCVAEMETIKSHMETRSSF